MRDILFRGQTRRKGEYIVNMAGDKCESHWVYGGIFPQNKDGDFAIIYQQEPEIRKFTVYAETVGQFTGLTDKNDKRIFEGDIVSLVKHDGLIYKVVYVPCRYELVNSKGVNCFVLDIYKSENIEVIGNIHDNPELLGGENNGINR